MKQRWLWAALALFFLGGMVVFVGGYTGIQSTMTPFEEQPPESAADAFKRLEALDPQLRKTYERWQWIDALFVLCITSAMGIVCAVAKQRFRWGRCWTIAFAAVLVVIVLSEAMENAAIIGLINGHDRLGLLRAGTGTKWIAFPIAAGTCLVLLVMLGVSRLRYGPRCRQAAD